MENIFATAKWKIKYHFEKEIINLRLVMDFGFYTAMVISFNLKQKQI